MGVVKHWFPIALAIVWIAMAAMAIADFASFAASTQPRKPVVTEQRPVHSSRLARTAGTRANGQTLPN